MTPDLQKLREGNCECWTGEDECPHCVVNPTLLTGRGHDPTMGAMTRPATTQPHPIPASLRAAVEKAITMSFLAGQANPRTLKPLGDPDHLAATAEAELWDALADALEYAEQGRDTP